LFINCLNIIDESKFGSYSIFKKSGAILEKTSNSISVQEAKQEANLIIMLDG
jgi:hypothetical protein